MHFNGVIAFALGLCFFNDIPNLTIFGHFVRPMCDPQPRYRLLELNISFLQSPFYTSQSCGWASQHFSLLSCIFSMQLPLLSFFNLLFTLRVTPWPLSSWTENVWKVRKKNIKNEPNLTSVAQSVQKLFHIQGNFSQKLRWKMATPCHRVKSDFVF